VRELPSGTVTLLFTDIEGSTRLLDELGAERYREALGEHRRVLREAFARHGGYEVDYEGDAFFVAFQDAAAGVAAASEAQAALAGGPVSVRMGLHTGRPLLDPPKYVGRDVHLAARVMGAGHGGQILLSQATRSLVEGDAHQLGEHRLKDFEEPVSLFQLGDGAFPPLKTISNTNLPRPASSFVGREREVGEVVGLVRGGARLVTLTGPGGSGKTRLAIEAAAELVGELRAGVFWVGLATLRDPALVLPTIEHTLGAKHALSEHIGEREMLLLLDNLEQVIEAAPQLAGVVEACPNLRVLVTSREVLRVRGEVEYAVLPLADPDAVELFCARAAVDPSPSLEELCRRLDSMPLALELAAARSAVLTPAQILDRLAERLDLFRGRRDADPRQRTLRATIEWSHDLLDTDEQQLFARLAVFPGGCTLDSAAEVAHADLDTLQSLVEKSLVRRTGERFWMLETIRDYAAERLEGLPDREALDRRFRDFFLQLALSAEAGERGPEQAAWWDRLEEELDNLRSALDRAHESRAYAAELELATLLKRFWHVHGRLAEGRQRIESALALAPDVDGIPRARALDALAHCSFFLGGDPFELGKLSEQSLEIYADAGDAAGVARMTLALGTVAYLVADMARARALYNRAHALALEVGDLRYASFAAHNLANLAFVEHDYPLAVELSEESLAAARVAGDPSTVQSAALLLAYVLAGAGRYGEARVLCLDVLREATAQGVKTVARDALDLLVITDAEAGDAERAALLAGCVDRLREDEGEPRQASGDRLYRPALTRAEMLLGTARFREVYEQGAGLLSPADALALSVDSPP
jgi:predicted ATPase